MIHATPIRISDLSIGKDAFGKSGISFSAKNRIIDAKVVRLIPPSKAELIISGKKIIAETSVELTKGETIQLELIENGNFKFVKPPIQYDDLYVQSNNFARTACSLMDLLSNDMHGLIKIIQPFLLNSDNLASSCADQNCSGSDSLTDLIPLDKFSQIRDILLSFSLKSDEPDNDFLPRLIERSGLTFEKKLFDSLKKDPSYIEQSEDRKMQKFSINNNVAMGSEIKKLSEQDLKACIIKFMADPQSKTNNTTHYLKEFSQAIEKFQIVNAHSSESGSYLIPFPVFFNGTLTLGQIFLNLGDRIKQSEKKKQRMVKVSILLTMSSLGPVRTDMVLLRKDLSGRIQVKNRDVCLFVQKMLPKLKFRLKGHGFNVLALDCEVTSEERFDSKAFLYNLVHKKEDIGFNIVI